MSATAFYALAAVSGITSGIMKRGAYKANQREYEARARLETINGEFEVGRIKEDLNEALAAQNVAFGASGWQRTGSVLKTQEADRSEANRLIRYTRLQASYRGLNMRMQALQARNAGRTALLSGVLGGASDIASGLSAAK